MKKILNVVFVILCILLLLPIIDAYFYNQRELNILEVEYKTIKYRTGDILFFKWQDMNMFNKTPMKMKYNMINYTQTYLNSIPHIILCKMDFAHSGIVIVINNIPYIYELNVTSAYPFKKVFCKYRNKLIPKNNIKPVLHNISDIKCYLGDIYHISYIGPKIKEYIIFNVLEIHKDDILSHVHLIYNRFFEKKHVQDKQTTCIGFIVTILEQFGIETHNLNQHSIPLCLKKFCIKSIHYNNFFSKINKY
jgi:hypothetical protein